MVNTKKITSDFFSTTQVSVEDMAQIAAQGFKTVFNCRPDNEDGANQPTDKMLKIAAEKYELHYIHVPVKMGSNVKEQAKQAALLLQGAPKPVLGFCKSGMRATNLYLATANVYE